MPTATRRRKVHTHEFGRIDGSGPSRAAAKLDASEKAIAALTGIYDPVLIRWSGWTAVIWRDPAFGWTYKLLPEIPDGHCDLSACVIGQYGRDQATQYAASHLLQLALDVDTTRTDDQIPGLLTDPQLRRELLSHCRWQRAARFAMGGNATGIDPTDSNAVHRYACDHCRDPQFA